MADEEESGEKTEEPSQHRIDEFRNKGQVAASRDLVSVLTLSGAMATLIFTSAYLFELFTDLFQWIFAQRLENIFTDQGMALLLHQVMWAFFKAIIPVMVSSFVLGFLGYVMQIGFVYAPEMLEMQIDRINPINGFKRLFSMKIIFDFFKTLFKFIVIVAISYYFIKQSFYDLNGLLQLEILQTILFSKIMVTKLIFVLLLFFLIVALIDFGWEKFQYRKKLLQTRHQAREELKEKEGNPEIKQRIRAIQREVAHKRMMADVPKADVIVANPTHISVALKYDKEKMVAPTVVAKGSDLVALRIREIAKENNVAIVENVTLARTLYATVKIGEAIPRTLYKAVADILTYVYKLKRKQKAVDGEGV